MSYLLLVLGVLAVVKGAGRLLLSFFAIFPSCSASAAQRVAGMEELVPQERSPAAALALARTEGVLFFACCLGYLAAGIARVPLAAGGFDPV